LKSQALLEIERLERRLGPIDLGGGGEPPQEVLDLLASFRVAAVAQVIDRLDRLQERQPLSLLAVSGGAAANRLLRRELPAWAERNGVELRLVPLLYSGDNAAMIAHAALLRHRRGVADDPFAAEAESRIPL
jgi:N6-L-threonylcarbamoyladenine synthase